MNQQFLNPSGFRFLPPTESICFGVPSYSQQFLQQQQQQQEAIMCYMNYMGKGVVPSVPSQLLSSGLFNDKVHNPANQSSMCDSNRVFIQLNKHLGQVLSSPMPVDAYTRENCQYSIGSNSTNISPSIIKTEEQTVQQRYSEGSSTEIRGVHKATWEEDDNCKRESNYFDKASELSPRESFEECQTKKHQQMKKRSDQQQQQLNHQAKCYQEKTVGNKCNKNEDFWQLSAFEKANRMCKVRAIHHIGNGKKLSTSSSITVVCSIPKQKRIKKSKEDYYNDSNYTKNLLKGFRRYLSKHLPKKFQEDFWVKRPLNNELVLQLYSDRQLSQPFSDFLSMNPTWWIAEAKIKDGSKQLAFFNIVKQRLFACIKTKRKNFSRPPQKKLID